MLTIERLGVGNPFSAEEFELVQLFAAQVSIALQNAEVFRDVEIRAQTDGLTGLLNHATFEEHLGRAVRDGAPFGLIMLDLDDFRAVNDSMGHQAGDEHPARDRRAPSSGPAATPTSSSATAATSSRSCCRTPTPPARGRSPNGRRRRSSGLGAVRSPPRSASRPSRSTARRRPTSCSPPTARASSPSAVAAIGVATAAEGLALAAEFRLQAPTPVDSAARPGD